MRIRMFCWVAAVLATPAVANDWLQFGYDTAHSSFNRAETGYSTPNGNTILYHYALPSVSGSLNPGTVDGAPVYLGGVSTAAGTKNVLFALRNDGTLLALDADSTTLNVIWSRRPAGSGMTTMGFGSPAIDPGLSYVYSYGFDGKIHKYQVGDGTEVATGGWPEVSTLKPEVEKGAAGLSIATAHNGSTYLYAVTDGYIGDANDYQGHLTAINLTSGAQNVFNTLCSNKTIHFCNSAAPSCSAVNDCSARMNGIWGRPGAVYDSGTDRVFITTGNGPYNANVSGTYNWGDSVLALHPDGTGSGAGAPVDSYTPTTFQQLQDQDSDLGAVSIAILPPPPGTAAQYLHIALQTGKDACMRLLNLGDLSGHAAPRYVGGELQALDYPGASNCATGYPYPRVTPQPAIWVNPADTSTWIFVASYFNTVAYRVVLNGTGRPSLAQQWTSDGGSSALVANGTVYYISVSGYLRALDAVTGTQIDSASSSWATAQPLLLHWQSPILVNGRVYLFDHANPSELWVYQLDGVFRSTFE